MSKHTRTPDKNREFLSASVMPDSLNPEQRTVDCIFFTGADVARVDYWTGERYILRFNLDGADLSLLNNSAPIFDNHQSYGGAADQKGVVERAWRDAAGLKATLRFSKRPDVDGLWADVADRILTKFSMGVELLEVEEKRNPKTNKLELKTATKFRVFEISLAPLPADWGTTTLKAEENGAAAPLEGNNMNENTQTTGMSTAQAEALRGVAKNMGLADFAEGLIAAGVADEAARTALLNRAAERSSEHPISTVRAEVTRDQRDGIVERAGEALACRYTGKAPGERGREFAGARISDIAREVCRMNGIRTSWSGEETIRLAMGTSDFPLILGNTTNRILLDAYALADPAIKRICRRATAADFRTRMLLRLGSAPQLELVPEHGSIPGGSRPESGESYRLYTFAKTMSITRQALVNDDLGAFSDYVRAYGAAAARVEAERLTALLVGAAGVGPTMSDANPLFDAVNHGNHITGPGTVINVANLGTVRQMLRLQTDLVNADGTAPVLGTGAKYLVVPAALETTSEQYLETIVANVASSVNPFPKRLELIVNPLFDATLGGATRWYVFSDPAGLAPVLEYAYLEGAEGPQVETRPGWEMLGMEFRCYLDFGCGAIGWRGAVCNDGA
ncbi:MAG: hypothetical protein IT158_20010 [Bryobacterales bacterium]|nr:hypothetical protein [Bryobacterales bacterium]